MDAFFVSSRKAANENSEMAMIILLKFTGESPGDGISRRLIFQAT